MNEANPGGSFEPKSCDFETELSRYQRIGAHWRRYKFAASIADELSVLDVGCGSGFGASAIAPKARSYFGIDVDARAIEWASRWVGQRFRNVRFQASGVPPGERFDLITCFEVIEHVSDPTGLISQLYASLRPNGRLVMSTPNGAFAGGDKTRFRSPFHIHEFTGDELKRILSSVSPVVTYLKEYRVDHMDVIGLRLGVPNLDRRAMYPAVRGALDLVQQHLDPSWVWRISKLPESQLNSRSFSTLLAVVHRQ